MLNRAINLKLANLINKSFFEVIASPSFKKNSINVLKKRKNLILFKLNKVNLKKTRFRSTIFGKLTQIDGNYKINNQFLRLASKRKASKKFIEDLIFSLKVAKHLKSNAVVLASNKKTVGLGMGQTNRVDALKIAINKMFRNNKSKNYVCASDGFFPFTDSIALLNKKNCKVIAQPFGSINDEKIVKYAKKHNISLYFTKNRLFKH